MSEQEWKFQKGETLIKDDISGTPSMPGLSGTLETEVTEYTVERRLIDPDENEQFYYIEWEENAVEGSISDKNIRNMLYSASLVHMHFNSKDTNRGE